jgi:hypothetical protein
MLPEVLVMSEDQRYVTHACKCCPEQVLGLENLLLFPGPDTIHADLERGLTG